MDINCTNNCTYQQDGKCSLNELPSLSSSSGYLGFECPYFSQIIKLTSRQT